MPTYFYRVSSVAKGSIACVSVFLQKVFLAYLSPYLQIQFTICTFNPSPYFNAFIRDL